MSGVRMFKVPNRLGRLMFNGKGVSVRDALIRADEAIEDLRPPCLDIIDATLAEIESRFGHAAPDRAGQPLDDLYALSSTLIDVGIGLKDSGVDDAAKALCDLVDRSLSRNVRNWEAVDLHIQTLLLLRARGQSFTRDQRHSVLIGLKKVMVKRVGSDDDVEAA